MTQEELEQLGAYWQERLRLRDWHLLFCLVPHRQIPHDCWGHTDITMTRKVARVLVLDPDDDDTANDILPHEPYDPEQILVHELLHLHMEAFFPTGEGQVQNQAEVAINLIAHALVDLKRAGV